MWIRVAVAAKLSSSPWGVPKVFQELLRNAIPLSPDRCGWNTSKVRGVNHPDWLPRAALTSHSVTEILCGCFHTSEDNETPNYFFQTAFHLKTEVSTNSWPNVKTLLVSAFPSLVFRAAPPRVRTRCSMKSNWFGGPYWGPLHHIVKHQVNIR